MGGHYVLLLLQLVVATVVGCVSRLRQQYRLLLLCWLAIRRGLMYAEG